ncbi:hypothetical protein F2Q70_00039274 [Brassica cretica]|uniref:Uncharacterized protein n=1 Tax=Brassica cretica TaxID=69181 RepID=A0A8S9K0Y0_BRACR|nr:hypothetical protein F2Q70_00039274 [Brassica cretica]
MPLQLVYLLLGKPMNMVKSVSVAGRNLELVRVMRPHSLTPYGDVSEASPKTCVPF